MISEIMKNFDRNTVIALIITSIISLFYNYIILYIYILCLIFAIILTYKWAILDIKILNSALKNIAVSVITIFSLTFLGEIWLQLYPHRFTGIYGLDTVGEFSDYSSRDYLTENVK